jgi:hypothetical protein
MASITVDLLAVFTEITPQILDIYIALFGVPCDIYYSATTPQETLFDEHQKLRYPSTPNISGENLLIVGFINNSAFRGVTNQFDSIFGEGENRPYIITYEAKRLPPRTKIHAHFGGSRMSFETEIDKVITGVKLEGTPYGTYDTIMVKQILRPLT